MAERLRPIGPQWRPPAFGPEIRYPFVVGAPDHRAFPWDLWRKIVNRTLRAYGRAAGFGAGLAYVDLTDIVKSTIGTLAEIEAKGETAAVHNASNTVAGKGLLMNADAHQLVVPPLPVGGGELHASTQRFRFY